MEYFITRDGKVNGPFSEAQVKSGFKSGKLNGTDLISGSKDGPWKLVRKALPRQHSNASDSQPPKHELFRTEAPQTQSPPPLPPADDVGVNQASANASISAAIDRQLNPRLCLRCRGIIHSDAVVCPHCQLWQDPKQYLANFVTLWIVLMIFCFGFGFIVFALLKP